VVVVLVVVVVVAMAVVVLNLSFGLAACNVMLSFWFAVVAVVLGCHPGITANYNSKLTECYFPHLHEHQFFFRHSCSQLGSCVFGNC
jgi:hypothetical protein